MRECKRQGCHVLLLTAEKLRDAGSHAARKPGRYVLSLPLSFRSRISFRQVTHLARKPISLIASSLSMSLIWRRLRLFANTSASPAWGSPPCAIFVGQAEAMRMRALDRGSAQCRISCPSSITTTFATTSKMFGARGVLKPRQEAAAIGIKKIYNSDELWTILGQLGDKRSLICWRSSFLARSIIVDSVVSENDVVFANVSKYGKPPMNVAQQRWRSFHNLHTVPRGTDADTGLRTINRQLIAALGLMRGVAHTEFIQAQEDGHFYFLECAARVGGAYISEMVEAATDINLWREWARIEIAGGDGTYKLPPAREEYAGVVLSLARQENPDTSAYSDPEVCLRIKKHHHAGLVLRSNDPERVRSLLETYAPRFVEDFLAVEPPREKPTS